MPYNTKIFPFMLQSQSCYRYTIPHRARTIFLFYHKLSVRKAHKRFFALTPRLSCLGRVFSGFGEIPAIEYFSTMAGALGRRHHEVCLQLWSQ